MILKSTLRRRCSATIQTLTPLSLLLRNASGTLSSPWEGTQREWKSYESTVRRQHGDLSWALAGLERVGGMKVGLSVCFGWIWWAAWAMMEVDMRWPGG